MSESTPPYAKASLGANLADSLTDSPPLSSSPSSSPDSPDQTIRGSVPSSVRAAAEQASSGNTTGRTPASLPEPTDATSNTRPSFWRRIALGGRRQESAEALNTLARPSPKAGSGEDIIDQRIVEPLLQALVSVEAKLERSHIELTQRSDQVEERLTQLWDIEEQLSQLSEVHESVMRLAEQQQRLESSVQATRRTQRWVAGGVLLVLIAAGAAFALFFR